MGFSDNAGLTVHNLPEGTDTYRNTFDTWSPRFALGYCVVHSKWSCELQLQLGPKESFEAFKGNELLVPAAKFQSRFLTASLNRTYSLRQDYEIEAKIGVVNASFDSQVRLEDSVRDLKLSETNPMLSIGLLKRNKPRLSAGIYFTNYYLPKTGTITTVSIGLRYEF
ncbi:MAG: hypothetical protein F4X44_12230 [Gammaproteobacteria bacterium]|nr:hypothetical protein [Gammaproteobacteria bacterium]